MINLSPKRVISTALLILFVMMTIAWWSSSKLTKSAHSAMNAPALSVDASVDQHTISPYIYGVNFAEPELAEALRLPINRWGGNATTRYNWQNDVSNRAGDWFFENIPNDNHNVDALPNGAASDQFVEQNLATGTETLMTIPMIGWTPKQRERDCGFSVSKYGAQQSVDPWNPDCGNGTREDGTIITDNDPFDTSIAIDEAFVQAWIEHLIRRYGNASAGGVKFYSLDNEPMLWNHVHRDVHPQPASYDEIRDRTYQYASALKATDPTAQTFGPAVWGWTAYFYSALDWSADGAWWANPQDRNAHGGTPFLEWYLQQMAAYEQQHGVRLLDYLDLHYYPQHVGLTPVGDEATQALRLRSTRALWDPTYIDESWIGEPVQLIPLMHSWVDTHYPGTKLAISEYNWGALDHINGALAQADILGIFGREALDMATLWDPPQLSDPGAFAIRIYRNYDGEGSAFGNISLSANSSNQEELAIYAARRDRDNILTIMVINKTGNNLNSELALSGVTPLSNAEVYRYSEANLSAIVREADQAVTNNGFTADYPANSITLFVFNTSSTPSATATASAPSATPTPVEPVSTAEATATAIATPSNGSGSLNLFVWKDSNGDGAKQSDERGIEEVAIKLIEAGMDQILGSRDDISYPTQSTDLNGTVQFNNLPTGSYQVDVDEQTLDAGLALTTGNEPLMVTLSERQPFEVAHLGYAASVCKRSVMYGIHHDDNLDNQFFMIDLATHESTPIGEAYHNYDIKAIELDPTSGELYALAGGDGTQQGKLFKLERERGTLNEIGQTSTGGQYEIISAAFASDGTLWAFQQNVGLLNINLNDGSSRLNWSFNGPGNANWEGLAWDATNSYLYGSEGSHLYRWNPSDQRAEPLCGDHFLPNPTEALDTRFDGQLVGGWHNPVSNTLDLFEIDTSTCTTRPLALNTPYNNIESLAFEPCSTGGTVSGTVINGREDARQHHREGEPVPNVQLKLELDANQDGEASSTSYTTTDEEGKYHFVNLPLGRYRLSVGNSTDAVEFDLTSDEMSPTVGMSYTDYEVFVPIAIEGR